MNKIHERMIQIFGADNVTKRGSGEIVGKVGKRKVEITAHFTPAGGVEHWSYVFEDSAGNRAVTADRKGYEDNMLDRIRRWKEWQW